MMNITSYKEKSRIKLDDILEFMATKSAAEKAEFKAFCTTPIEVVADEGQTRMPSFFEIRNWVCDRYFPDMEKPATAPKMIDRILAL